MPIFFLDLSLCVGMLIWFSISGWWAVAPFKDRIGYPFAAAILAGMLLLACLTLTVHVATQLHYNRALIVCAVVLFLLSTIFGVWRHLDRSLIKTALIFLIGISMVACALLLSREIQYGSPALVFESGSDQFGYAQFADWLVGNPKNTPLTSDPSDPFFSWIEVLLKLDPRAGVFSYITIVAIISHRSGLFSYNLACVIALLAGSIGLAGLYARSRLTFLIIFTSTFFSSWLNCATSGFLGKVVGYPAAIFCIGLFLFFYQKTIRSKWEPIDLLAAISIAVSAALVYNGMAAVTILGLIGGFLILLEWLRDPERSGEFARRLIDVAILLIIICIATYYSSGTVARPLYMVNDPHFMGSWKVLYEQAFQLVSPESPPSLANLNYIAALLPLEIVVWAIVLMVIIKYGTNESLAMLLGSMAIFIPLSLANQQWKFFESTSIYLPLTFCAVALTMDAAKNQSARVLNVRSILMFSAVVIFLSGIGRIYTAIEYTYGKYSNPQYTFLSKDLDDLVGVVTHYDGVLIDTADVTLTSPLVLELTKRHVPYQMSPRAWTSFLGYRPWSPPVSSQPYHVAILPTAETASEHGKVIATIRQYTVVER